jgi:hypothetical protein
MLRFDLTVRGQTAVTNTLRTAAAKAPKETQEVTYRWAQNVRAKLKATPYPPKRAGQKYIRTGRLASSWRVDRRARSVVIANSATQKGRTYPRFVVGDDKGSGQAWFHKGRWWKARQVIDEERPALNRDMRQMLNRLLKVRGGV